MADIITAWQCIGCGKIEAPQQCVGVCQDRRIELVDAKEHRAVLARSVEVDALLRQIAFSTPHDDAWQASYRALQERARKLLRPA